MFTRFSGVCLINKHDFLCDIYGMKLTLANYKDKDSFTASWTTL
jgi:hypothetical protein